MEGSGGEGSQQFVAGSTAAFRCDPVDDLIGIHDVAGLAMNAVGSVDL